MTPTSPSSPRERILQAALVLLETEGVEAVSTRSVSARADVQAPTIYRQFGDMQGLLSAVASAGFTAYLQTKEIRTPLSDPVEELRVGWNVHVEFGLTHPHLYTLMYGAAPLGGESPAAKDSFARLQGLMQRVAEAGRLAVSVERAAAMLHAAAMGVTLSLIKVPAKDKEFSERMCEAVLAAILTHNGDTTGGSIEQQTAAHAVALIALLPRLKVPLSEAERTLLLEWLQRLL